MRSNSLPFVIKQSVCETMMEYTWQRSTNSSIETLKLTTVENNKGLLIGLLVIEKIWFFACVLEQPLKLGSFPEVLRKVINVLEQYSIHQWSQSFTILNELMFTENCTAIFIVVDGRLFNMKLVGSDCRFKSQSYISYYYVLSIFIASQILILSWNQRVCTDYATDVLPLFLSLLNTTSHFVLSSSFSTID